jgi:hypothetical protein
VQVAGAEKVFNTLVENSVEKGGRIFVSGSVRDGSTLCTGASAGTLVVFAGSILNARED